MSTHSIAWVVIVLATTLNAATLFHLLRNRRRLVLRALCIATISTFFMVPAPIPGHAEQFAPAFIVCLFEFFFQIDGSPGLSFRILVLATGLAVLLTWLGHNFFARYYLSRGDE